MEKDTKRVADAKQAIETELKKFSGTIHTIAYRPHEGFADYAVATLTLKDGKIVAAETGDPLAAFEALARLETTNERMLEKMRKGYPEGHRHV